MIHITLTGAPRTKKNSPRIYGHKVLPSKAYMEYEEDCGYQLVRLGLQNAQLDGPMNLKAVYYMPTKRRVDLVNLLEATCDILVHCGVLVDDNCAVIVGHDGSRVMYDKSNPRVEIELSELEE